MSDVPGGPGVAVIVRVVVLALPLTAGLVDTTRTRYPEPFTPGGMVTAIGLLVPEPRSENEPEAVAY
ncbi:hypothetical protein GCM10027299_33650 [Larkinella ripae]